ncbi:unnamed protein product [Toxocara canis]|uniref:MBOAT family protein n=1 Tax=Toxocara canis TaxID=6265 RepID=A0A183UHW7_TOXCA|nr:unnamed protein product [Toxocara canis]
MRQGSRLFSTSDPALYIDTGCLTKSINYIHMLAEEKRNMCAFILPRLAQLELLVYYAIWIAHSLGAFLLVYKITHNLRRPMQTWLPRSKYSFLMLKNGHFKTNAFTVVSMSEYLSVVVSSLKCMLTFAILAVSAVVVSVFVHTEIAAWAICISFIMKANLYAPFSSDARAYYREFNFYLYGAIKVINFCIYLTRNKITTLRESDIIRYAQYLLYPPYTSMLIVIYEDFDMQMSKVENQQQTEKRWPLHLSFTWELLWNLLRLIIWYFAFELLLHVIYVHSFFNVPFPPFDRFSNYELAATAYVNGQLFFWKYVIIFGIPSWFALFDGMSPPKPPICISRVSRYSRMWRNFDRGLYQFLKNQVYLPLMGDLNGAYLGWRRFGAMVGAFVFVLAWHGTSSNYVCWVVLSGCELCIERIGYAIASTSAWSKMSMVIGRRNQRRLIAFAMLATVIPGIFGVFFFLGRDGFGKLVFKKVLMDGAIDVLHLRISLKNR